MKPLGVLAVFLTICLGSFSFYPLVQAALPSPRDAQTKNLSHTSNINDQEVDFLQFTINYMYRSAGKGSWKILGNGSFLESGDHYKIIFTASEASYIYVFQIDSANKVYQLFPMKEYGDIMLHNENPVQAGKTYYIPAEEKSFVLDKQTGTEKLYFLASRTQDTTLEYQYQRVVEHQQKTIDPDKQLEELDELLEYASRLQGNPQVSSQPEQGKRVVWKEAGETFSVLQQRLENMCDGCVHVITFEHD